MKCIMVMFDSLNRHMLPPYGCDWTHAPNFERLAERTVTFDRSLRLLHALHARPARAAHRPAQLPAPLLGPARAVRRFRAARCSAEHGVYTHLATDHYHYWEDGGCTYHNRYNSWEFFRGQEGDPWKGQVRRLPASATDGMADRAMPHWRAGLDQPPVHARRKATCPRPAPSRGHGFHPTATTPQDNWFLQIETFDPHEPFFVPRSYKELYPSTIYKGPHFDWPAYRARQRDARGGRARPLRVCRPAEPCAMQYLGHVLDAMDELRPVGGHDADRLDRPRLPARRARLLGEDAGCRWYEEIAHTPLFIWDPRSKTANVRRGCAGPARPRPGADAAGVLRPRRRRRT